MQPLLHTVSMNSNLSLQNLHPLSLLAQVSSRQLTGCLQVTSPTNSWLLFLDQGRINYVTTTEQAFDRLDAKLRQLSDQIPTLVSAVRVQMRLLFEKASVEPNDVPDYQAICWLVQQQYLHPNQAATLIEAVSKQVLEEFLAVRQGAYELIELDLLARLPKYCQLNLRATVEECYGRMKQRQGQTHPVNAAINRNGATLPRSGQGMSPPAQISRPTGQSVGNPQSPEKTHYTIACIDDSPTVLRAINEFLDDKVFSVLMIDDPVKALMQIVRNKPDLILLDVTMPNLDGYELCSLLRRHSDFKNTPIIMVTGNTGFIDRAKAKLVRSSGYLTKPFNQSDLLKIVFKHLN